MKSTSYQLLHLYIILAFGLTVSAHSSTPDNEKLPSKSAQSSSAITSKEITLCEKGVKAFLASDYIGDGSVPKKLFTKEFARLWLKACDTPEGETLYWGADPILETQDEDPKLVRFGPGVERAGNIDVPVKYQHQGKSPFTKTFVFTNVGGQWLIADIVTSGDVYKTGSELEQLKKDFGN